MAADRSEEAPSLGVFRPPLTGDLGRLERIVKPAGPVGGTRRLEGVHSGATLDWMRLFRPYPRISFARPADAAELSELYARSWSGIATQLEPEVLAEIMPSTAEVEAWFRGGFEVYRASFDGELAGVVRVSFPTGAAMLDRLAVAPEQRRKGVGRALVEHAVNRGRKAGVTRAWVPLWPQLEDAMALHQAVGFRESLRHPGPGGELVLLELPL